MGSTPEITERLARRLKDERSAKGLSLDALARISGVSRSMLSQIERGESSPTVASLWNLTQALKVDFAELLDERGGDGGPFIEVLRKDATPVIARKDARCMIRILSAPQDVGATEIYDIAFSAGANLQSAPHSSGCIEALTVLEGQLEVTSDGQSMMLQTGDTLRYRADADHAIAAQEAARGLLVVKDP